jgi:arsenate reductase
MGLTVKKRLLWPGSRGHPPTGGGTAPLTRGDGAQLPMCLHSAYGVENPPRAGDRASCWVDACPEWWGRLNQWIEEDPVRDRPSVLFVCVHNAGRSQMAAGWLRHLAGDAVEVRSAGSIPADQVNPAAVEAMAEVGIDIADQRPQVLTTNAVEASDVVITMGCGDACPIFPGKRYLDWALEDPAGKGVESVRPIREDIEGRIRGLLTELGVPTVSSTSC